MKVKVKSSKSLGGRADGTKYDRSANKGFKVPEVQQAASTSLRGAGAPSHLFLDCVC